MIKALLKSKTGSQTIPNGREYYLSKMAVGTPAIIIAKDDEAIYSTSDVRNIIVLGDELTLQTKNTVYYFEGVREEALQ